MIKVTYDNEVDAKYVSIKEGKIHETKTINDWLFFDVDEKGGVLGIEILDSSKRSLSLSTFDNELSECSILDADKYVQPSNKESRGKEQYVTSTEVVLA